MRNFLLTTALLAGMAVASVPAVAEDYVGHPDTPGSGETGCFHFQLMEFPGVEFGISLNVPGNQQLLLWSVMVEDAWAVGKPIRVHAGSVSAVEGCRGTNSTFNVTGIGIP